MGSATEPTTSLTLLGRMREVPFDQVAWDEFAARYGPGILEWCHKWGLQEADANDVSQMVLLRLAEQIRNFEYDRAGSFQGWLRTITHHAWRDFSEARGRAGLGSGDTQVLEALYTVEAREDLLDRLNTAFDREVLEEAIACVRSRLEPQRFRPFDLVAIQGRKPADAARELGMTVGAVWTAKSRVQAMVRAEICKLRGTEGSDK